MKSLDQLDAKLESRTAITTTPTTIGASGSYYLTGDLAVTSGNAITISADNVSLNLKGFTISSTASPAAGTAVLISTGRSNVSVRNGQIRGITTVSGGVFTTGGFVDGISSVGSTGTNLHFSDLRIAGMGQDGINLNSNSVPSFVVERCCISVCAGVGIRAALIRDCAVESAGGTAVFGDVAVNCFGRTVVGNATAVFGGSVVDGCHGVGVDGAGISGISISNSTGVSGTGTGLNSTNASNCSGTSASGTGLGASANATNCSGTSTSGVGLFANANATNCSGKSTSGTVGLQVTGTASFCRGTRDGGTAVSASIAIGCTVSGTGTVTSANKFLGTP